MERFGEIENKTFAHLHGNIYFCKSSRFKRLGDMNIGIAVNYFKRIYSEVTELSRQTGYNRFYHLWDYLTAFVLHGAHIKQYTVGGFWRYSNPQRSKCMTLYRLSRLSKRYNDSQWVHYFKNKPEFNRYFADFIGRQWLYVKDSSYEEFKSFVYCHKTVIIKPMGGKEGIGIRKFVYNGESDNQLRRFFDDLVQEDVVVEELIKQHQDMNLGNVSVNTVRMLTICRPSDGQAQVLKAILRAGVGDSLVDNTALGGYFYEVDVATGVVTSKGFNRDGNLTVEHPGTDKVMLGFKVPLWEQVIEICLKAARQMPYMAIVGWDVAVTTDGVLLVEGNNNPDYQHYEFLGTIGYYEKIKTFLEGK